jgi:O-antigen/teichoic acid export membrane protein
MTKLHLGSLKREFTSQTGFLLIATTMGYTFGYLYLVLMGRALGPEVFGILGSLVGIFYIACLVGQALREATASSLAEIKAKAGEAVAVGSFLKLGTKLGLLCPLPALVFILASQQIASFFHLNSVTPVLLLGFSLSTTLLLEIISGLLQGLQQFRMLGIITYLVSQGLKLLFGVAFVWVGWGLSGAVLALLASTAIAIMAGLVLIRRQLAGGIHRQVQHNPGLVPILIPTLILAIFMAMPTSVDVMLVTHFFDATDAGLYNSAATMGKVVIFLPMAVSFVLLPKATENHTLGLGSRKILLHSLLYAFILSGGLGLLYGLIPDTIIKLFFGPDYVEAGNLIGWYGMAMLLFSLNFVLIHYSLAIRNMGLMLLAAFITLAEVAAIVLMHQSLSQVILVLLFGNLLIFLCNFPFLIGLKRL